MTNFDESAKPELNAPSLDSLVAAFDVNDNSLQMTYSMYMEKPSPKRMNSINTAVGELYNSYGDLLRKLTQDHTDVIAEDESVDILAGLLWNMNNAHTQLLTDYSDAVVLPTENESRDALECLKNNLTENGESADEFVDEAIGQFRAVLSTDMEVIEHYVFRKMDSPLQRTKEQVLRTSISIAKIGSGVVAGLFIYDKLNRNKD